ncbi:transglycosylase family protein [Kitasatospora sp. A2-31]|uniref:transglycosylase family protein n=1 Tax=Kitasatospora sp. A2-31 TaxID=2916414 RepID=UPI001EEAA298|nr:transglycosylase family protein [Kitasatospora sp. A2-31]MCG6496848.1 transglycosylase family protein [Kitasatospora sp. A2-31]
MPSIRRISRESFVPTGGGAIRRGGAAGAAVAAAVVAALAAAAVPATAVVLPDGRARTAVTVADLVWDDLAECESGGDWRADTGNGYFGGLQIWPPTWEEAGGLRFADRPDHASRRQQTAVAEEILRMQGWEAWPVCAREIGMIADD